DAVAFVEADELGEEGGRAVGRLVGVHAREAEPGVIVDRDEQVLPAGLALGLTTTIAGNAMPGLEDAAELLAVDVHELAAALSLVADDFLAHSARDQARAPMPA